MEIYLHSEYRQFTRQRQPGEVITVRDNVGASMVARGSACPVVDGEHQCQFSAAAPVRVGDAPVYLDEMQDNLADGILVRARWSRGKRERIRQAGKRSLEVRRIIRGRNLEDITPGMLK